MAVAFIVALFLLKEAFSFRNQGVYRANNDDGLSYAPNMTFEELVTKDTDGDGIPDWEEKLYGLDPTKKETTPGVPDASVINKLIAEQGNNPVGAASGQGTEGSTKTDEFSRELFSMIAALSQGGTLDQQSIENISSSLAEQIQNAPARKIFSVSDIKTASDNSIKAVSAYKNTLINVLNKIKMPSYTTEDVLQKFMVDQNNIDTSVLKELDPIVEGQSKMIQAISAMSVPQSLSALHVDFLNGLERVMENTSDMRLYDSDPILALGAISQYENNMSLLDSAMTNLEKAVNQKLGY